MSEQNDADTAAAIRWQHLDALSGEHDREQELAEEFEHFNDETLGEVKRREASERTEERDRQALNGPHGAAVYRRLISRSRLLTDGECRLLCALTTFGGRLENSFPSLRKIQEKLGGRKRSLAQISQLRASCEKKGFLRRVHLTINEHDELIEVESGGRFISAIGNQFRLPAGFFWHGSAAWDGPKVWSRRLYAKPTSMSFNRR
jgi:hypothetical protein